ncbi:hypothetical protein [Bradyrhizobium sp. 15]|uniref:hypothetical protein n=1 Tax=Bradyrhizobium sp. 15 TaxID=2782633 RepID=UPI001FF86BB4|nr:hypothetical protein [Bradyrhizobium sp. 15]MCK1439760.1 hypothetical protein [Bradyrhizobium sp. 15]
MAMYGGMKGASSRDWGCSKGTVAVPSIAIWFWTTRLLVAGVGGILGEVLNGIYFHRSGRVIIALVSCFATVLALRAAALRFRLVTFWSGMFVASVLGAVLARTIDTALGVGEPAATLQIVPLLVLTLVICYRKSGGFAALTEHPVDELFFWPIGTIHQTLGSALAGWARSPGGPGYSLALMVVALGLLTTIGLSLFTRLPRAALFWIAFLLTGLAAALGGIRGYEILFGP